MYALPLITLFALLVSLIAERKRTWRALRIAVRKLLKILPAFVNVLVIMSIVLYLIPEHTISYYLANDNRWIGLGIAAVLGSLTLMPGFIAYPLCGILLTKGVSYMVISAFSTTLMMVGFITYPIESAYLGARVTVVRNAIGLVIALVVALATGLFFGELVL